MSQTENNVILSVRNLTASIEGIPILKGVNLEVKAGETHAIMGRNGSGKSTFSKVLAGHPSYEVTGGEIIYQGQNLLEFEPEVRALMGVFLAFQYPIEIPGVSNLEFLRVAYNAKLKHQGKDEIDTFLILSGQVAFPSALKRSLCPYSLIQLVWWAGFPVTRA